MQRSKETHNPPGNIDPIKSCTQLEIVVFDDLGVVEEDVEETYLAAFLVCWLCKFVFLGKGVNLISLGVFKVTSRMTQGETFSLAIPVLASIYNGLNEIVCSLKPRTNAFIFLTHYLYGWLDEYFDTHFLFPS